MHYFRFSQSVRVLQKWFMYVVHFQVSGLFMDNQKKGYETAERPHMMILVYVNSVMQLCTSR